MFFGFVREIIQNHFFSYPQFYFFLPLLLFLITNSIENRLCQKVLKLLINQLAQTFSLFKLQRITENLVSTRDTKLDDFLALNEEFTRLFRIFKCLM